MTQIYNNIYNLNTNWIILKIMDVCWCCFYTTLLRRCHYYVCIQKSWFREKKELFTITEKDGNDFAFNGRRTFIPNSQQWVFQLSFHWWLPHFLGETIISRVRLVVTDGAVTEYVPFINNTGKDNPFPNSVHNLCHFHLVTQDFQNIFSLQYYMTLKIIWRYWKY